MNKKNKLIIGITGILAIVAVIGIGLVLYNSTMRKKYANEFAFSSGDSAFLVSDVGMYYFKNNNLMYLDSASQIQLPLCNQPECEHNNRECKAVFEGDFYGTMLEYGDYIYFHAFGSYQEYDEINDKTDFSTNDKLYRCKKDGSEQKEIYTTNAGCITSMMAHNGYIYFTAYTRRDASKIDDYMHDVHLYCYDPVWGKLTLVESIEGNDDRYSASLDFIKTDNSVNSYLILTYEIKGKSENVFTEYYRFDIEKLSVTKENWEMDAEQLHLCWPYTDKLYFQDGKLFVLGADDEDTRYYSVINENGEIEHILDIGPGVYAYDKGDYLIFGKGDYHKVLYDKQTNEMYFSKCLLGKSDAIVPSLICAIKDENICYFDATDYTDIPEGTVLTEDPTSHSCMQWDAYLDTFYEQHNGGNMPSMVADSFDVKIYD